jgi:DNA repair photolyase
MRALGRASTSAASILRLCEHVFVRWANLTIENETGARLPGFREPAVVRTFDAPEALGINFYEVQARSAINKVPDRSQMPFRYTINPYRGCTHACAYCLDGATPILMADGRTRPLSEVSAGDRVYGTIRRGQYRRYAITQVLDHWTTRKPAYRVTLDDGTGLIASGDHRFLSDRGWKHVIGTEWGGPLQRPHLTIGEKLIGSVPIPARSRSRSSGKLDDHLFSLAATAPEARALEGSVLRRAESRSVAAIEPIGGRDLFDITTGTGDFVANGVVSHNCFARPTHTYLDFNPREDFERQIVVKVNAPELVRKELARPSWKGDHVALGTNTDPYQWIESRYRVTEGIWEAMRDYANPCSVLTKSPLLLRDLRLFRELVERTEFVANLSVPTLDEKAWRATEPHTPHPRKRLEAVAELVRAGVPTGVLIAPLMPGINDAPEQVEPILELAGEAGARSIGGVALHLRGQVRDVWFDWLRQYRPDLLPRYEALYERGAYMAKGERGRLSSLVKPRGGGARGGRDVGRSPAARASRQGPDEPNGPAVVDPPLQSSLF